MEDSILTSTKKVLSINEDYRAFDPDIITFINSSFSTLNQLGIGPPDGFMIEDISKKWDDLGLSDRVQSMVKTYIFLKVRMLFDPPTTSFLLDAMKEQIAEHESRLTYFREDFVT